MPNISKPQKKAIMLRPSKTKKTNLPAPVKTKTNSPKSPHDYYCCCAEKTKQGIPKGTKITQLTQHCKQNSKKLALAKQQTRETEKKKILEN
jgi:hypothetical protein